MTILPVSQIPEAARADFEDCTITSVSPLRIKRDADAVELAFTPDTLVNTAFLTIGDRVRVDISRNPMLIIGRADGLQNVVTVSQLPNPNLLRNGTFRTNQRAYVSGTDLALGAYGFDGWKATTASSRMTFTAAPQGQMVTVPSGDSWGQVIERANVDAGAHTVSHAGTAQVRIYNVGATPPAYAASPVTAALDGTADVMVEVGPGTVSNIKAERGSVATPFVLDSLSVELERCERYYEKSYPLATAPGTAIAQGIVYSDGSVGGLTTGFIFAGIRFRTRKRTTPTVTVYDHLGAAGKVTRAYPGGTNTAGATATVTEIGETGALTYCAGGNASSLLFHYTASAEL